MTATTYDLVIIGGGQAAVPLAKALTDRGKRVALVERRHLGGSCVNFGCTPTKAAITSARIAHQARRAREYGVHVGEVTVDFAAVIERARRIARASRTELTAVAASMQGLDMIDGEAKLAGRDGAAFVVKVGDRALGATEVVLNTGTRSVVPPIDGLDSVDFVTAENWLDLTELPRHLIILGGGYIGLEMSQFYRRMGSEVTVVDSAERIATREDKDIADIMHAVLAGEGIRFVLNTTISHVAPDGDGVTVHLEGPDGARAIAGTHLFVATGRKPNTDNLGLETVGVRTDDQGYVEVDETLRTSVAGIWAAGDIRGGPMFTHTSWDDHRILRSQMVGDRKRTTDRIIPYAMFVDPSLGRVGMSEQEARNTCDHVKVATFAMSDSGKGKELGETTGMIKIVVDGSTDRILGAAVLSPDGGELVHVYVDLMNAGASYTVVRDAIHIHPTLAEDLQSVVAGIE